MIASELDPASIAELCRRGSIAFVDARPAGAAEPFLREAPAHADAVATGRGARRRRGPLRRQAVLIAATICAAIARQS
jgi:hypothetical protein